VHIGTYGLSMDVIYTESYLNRNVNTDSQRYLSI